MKRHGKKYLEAKKQVPEKPCTLEEAIPILKKIKVAKFEETMEIATMRMHQGRPVILFKGIASMNDADLLAGRELRIAESSGDDALLGEGEYYHRDLIGCEVVTESGESIGTVSGVEGDRAQTRLVVKSRRNEVLIPLADAICDVDVKARRITVRPPEGLLELNGEWR